MEIQKNNTEISKLEHAKSNTKSPEAKAKYQAAIEEIKRNNEAKLSLINNHQALESQKEITHQDNLAKIREKYRLKEQERFAENKKREIENKIYEKEEEIQAIETLEEAKEKLSQLRYLKLTEEELKNIKTLEDAKKALREEAQRAILEEQKMAITEQMEALNELINDPALSQEAREKLKKDLEDFKKQLQNIKGIIQGNEENDQSAQEKGNKKSREAVDVLGFSAQQWQDMFDNFDTTKGKVNGVMMAVKALGNAFSQFSKLQQALNEKELRRFTQNQDKKKQSLLRQLNQGLITQEQYQKSLQDLEDETAEKKRKLQERAAKAEKAANLMGAITGTASAVVGALGMKPWSPMNYVAAAIVGAMGAVQIATIAATPVPEFAEGGFTGKGSGKADRTGFKPAGIVHEQEYVTPKWMLENPVVADVVEWMESIRIGRTELPKGYAEGGFTEQKSNLLEVSKPQENLNTAELNNAIGQLRNVVQDLQEKGIQAYIIGNAENGKKMQDIIQIYERIKQKNARK